MDQNALRSMDLGRLRVFVRASELGSFSKAAVSLGVAQPTVSRVIGELEKEWQGPLFYRTGRGVALSELGEEALSKATFLLRAAETAQADLQAFNRTARGNVSIALPPSMLVPVIPTLINHLRSDYPGIRLEIYEGFNGQTERWLAEGTIDIGIYSKYREGPPGKTPLLLESQLVMVGLAKDWNLPAEIDFKRLAEFPLVLPSPTNGLRMIVDAVAKRLKVSLNIVAEAHSTFVHKEMVARCGCMMLKGSHAIAEEKRDGLLASAVIRRPYITRHFVMVTGHQRPLSRASRVVADLAMKILRGLDAGAREQAPRPN